MDETKRSKIMTDHLIEITLILAVIANIALIIILKRIALKNRDHKTTNTDIENLLKSEFSSNREEYSKSARSLREEITHNINNFNKAITDSFANLSTTQGARFEDFQKNLEKLSAKGLEAQISLRDIVEKKLEKIQNDNEKQLEKMRSTVEEKLQGTLEKRLSESFQQVENNLRQVHKGLGEMKHLAQGVGDLKKVLTNVKTRGTWGEFQLGNILEEVLSPEQYDKNVAIKRNSMERVEYAVKLPGQGLKEESIYLPIDSKFPQEDYQRLLEAQEQSNHSAMEAASSRLDSSIKKEARTIKEKYIYPPKTTDFAVMFLPTEGLYAEILRRPGLAESIQRDHRVIITGPTNFAALLNSLSVGFRTLAIQKRSSEVWKLLGAVKTHFGTFSTLLEGVQKKLDEASNKMERVGKKSKAIERSLSNVEELPTSQSNFLIPEENERL